MRYVPLVERDRLAQGYLDLRQTMETITKITKMYQEGFILSQVCCFRASPDDAILEHD